MDFLIIGLSICPLNLENVLRPLSNLKNCVELQMSPENSFLTDFGSPPREIMTLFIAKGERFDKDLLLSTLDWCITRNLGHMVSESVLFVFGELPSISLRFSFFGKFGEIVFRSFKDPMSD
ncbi:hypothetical protein GQR58_028610 [Nymphon striatum]|nr:hypothetical protein GQR58_028610 [Nymphon striatum]